MVFSRKIAMYLKLFVSALAGAVLACIAIEMLLHVTDLTDYNAITNDRQSGLLIFRPNSWFIDTSSCLENVVTINDAGFHAPPVAPGKGPHIFRILILGASYVEGAQVPVSKLLSSVLQDKLNAGSNRLHTYEVIPIGIAGNGTLLNTLYFMRFGKPLKPDLVIDIETGSEITHDVPGDAYPPRFDADGKVILSLPKSAQDSHVLLLKQLARASKLLVYLHSRYQLLQQALSDLSIHKEPAVNETVPTNVVITPEAEKLWPVEEKLTDALAAEATSSGAQFMIASWTVRFVPTTTAMEIPQRLGGIAQRAGFTYINLVPGVSRRERASGESSIDPCSSHWSAAGHRYVGETIYDYLIGHPALIGR